MSSRSTRRNRLWRDYGLTMARYEELVVAIGGACPICLKCVELVVDHDQTTQSTRGLICSKCNSGLGFFNDDAASLDRAASYLRKVASQGPVATKPTVPRRKLPEEYANPKVPGALKEYTEHYGAPWRPDQKISQGTIKKCLDGH